MAAPHNTPPVYEPWGTGHWLELVEVIPAENPASTTYMAEHSRLYDDLLRYAAEQHIDIDTLPDGQAIHFAVLVSDFCHGEAEDAVGEDGPIDLRDDLLVPAIALKSVSLNYRGISKNILKPELDTILELGLNKAKTVAPHYLEICMAGIFAAALEQEGCIAAASVIRTRTMSIFGAAILIGEQVSAA